MFPNFEIFSLMKQTETITSNKTTMENAELIKDLNSVMLKVNALANEIVGYKLEIEDLKKQLTEKDILLDKKISKIGAIKSLIDEVK